MSNYGEILESILIVMQDLYYTCYPFSPLNIIVSVENALSSENALREA